MESDAERSTTTFEAVAVGNVVRTPDMSIVNANFSVCQTDSFAVTATGGGYRPRGP